MTSISARVLSVPRYGPVPVVGLLGVVGVVILALSVMVATAVGTASVDPLDVAGIVVNQLPLIHVNESWRTTDQTIILQIRLPRVMAAAVVGASLALSGTLLQGVFRNPMAEPYLVGASSGAAFAAVLGFFLFPQAGFFVFGFSWIPLLGFVGALTAVAIVYFAAYSDGRVSVTTLLLAGVAVGAFLTALQSFIMFTRADDGLQMASVLSWLFGSVSTVGWDQFKILVPFVVIGGVLARMFAYPLNAMALGEERAGALGMPVEVIKLALIATSALLTAAAVAVAGLVGFVGLVVPHMVRLVSGPDHRNLVWLTPLYGASFVILADLAARTLISPQEIPIGVITGVIGGPFFLVLLRRSKGRYEF